MSNPNGKPNNWGILVGFLTSIFIGGIFNAWFHNVWLVILGVIMGIVLGVFVYENL